MTLTTGRLTLRPWLDADRAAFAAMSADPEVMRYLTALPTRADSDAWIDRQRAQQAANGFCFWAVELTQSSEFVGAVGLARIGYEAHFTPAVEIGWRLARPFWGCGYAPEAAAAALQFGFTQAGLTEIVANACMPNAASQSVMRKLGMARDPADDFDHPRLPTDSPLLRHVLYRLPREAWLARAELR